MIMGLVVGSTAFAAEPAPGPTVMVSDQSKEDNGVATRQSTGYLGKAQVVKGLIPWARRAGRRPRREEAVDTVSSASIAAMVVTLVLSLVFPAAFAVWFYLRQRYAVSALVP
ncbi:MAG: hypothetical protein Q8P50_03305 [Bacillota bacterium]|nr:hypothetical protein [Bacillota bacterium]